MKKTLFKLIMISSIALSILSFSNIAKAGLGDDLLDTYIGIGGNWTSVNMSENPHKIMTLSAGWRFYERFPVVPAVELEYKSDQSRLNTNESWQTDDAISINGYTSIFGSLYTTLGVGFGSRRGVFGDIGFGITVFDIIQLGYKYTKSHNEFVGTTSNEAIEMKVNLPIPILVFTY